MARKNNNKVLAEELYLNTQMTQKEICETVGVSEQTFVKWKKAGNWAEIKGATTVTANKVLQQLYIRAEQIASDLEASPDDIVKIASAIEKLKPNKITIANYINTFIDFGNWLKGVDLEATKLLNTYQKAFIDEKVSH